MHICSSFKVYPNEIASHDGVACTGECDITSGELKEAQKAGADLMQDRDELSAQLASVEQQLADTGQAHDDYKYSVLASALFTKIHKRKKVCACQRLQWQLACAAAESCACNVRQRCYKCIGHGLLPSPMQLCTVALLLSILLNGVKHQHEQQACCLTLSTIACIIAHSPVISQSLAVIVMCG